MTGKCNRMQNILHFSELYLIPLQGVAKWRDGEIEIMCLALRGYMAPVLRFARDREWAKHRPEERIPDACSL